MTDISDGSRHRRLWIIFGATLFLAFFILGFFGREVYRQAPRFLRACARRTASC
jgi:hypothetical protein